MNMLPLIESTNRLTRETEALKTEFPKESWRFRSLELEIESIRNLLLAEQRRQTAFKSGSGAEFRAFNRLLKRACRDDLKKGWKDEDGRLYACDGYVAVRLNDPQFTPPLAENRVMDFDTIIQSGYDIATTEDNLPDYTDLKTYYSAFVAKVRAEHNSKQIQWIKSSHNNKFPCYYHPENGPYLFVEDLLLVMEILPDAKLCFSENYPLRPAYMKGPSGTGIILPIRATDNNVSLIQVDNDSIALRAGTYFAA